MKGKILFFCANYSAAKLSCWSAFSNSDLIFCEFLTQQSGTAECTNNYNSQILAFQYRLFGCLRLVANWRVKRQLQTFPFFCLKIFLKEIYFLLQIFSVFHNSKVSQLILFIASNISSLEKS